MKHGKRHANRATGWVFVLLVGFAVGCGGEKGQEGPQLSCEKEGMPCTVEEVPEQARYRGFLLSYLVEVKRFEGMELAAIQEWLAEQPDVVEIKVDGGTVGFRVEGGPWKMSFPSRQPDEPPMEMRSMQASARSEETSRAELVVGDQAKPARDTKSALVLGTFAQEVRERSNPWANYSDDVAAKEGLSDMRGYVGGPVHLQDEQADVSAFQSFEAFDTIHVSTHGGCLASMCLVTTGERPVSPYEIPDDKAAPRPDMSPAEMQRDYPELYDRYVKMGEWLREKYPGMVGVFGTALRVPRFNPSDSENPGRWLNFYVTLTQDFFRTQYPGGLEDKFIFLSACQASRVIGPQLAAEGTSVLGWVGSVYMMHSRSTVEAFYRLARETGRSVRRILEHSDIDVFGDGYPGRDLTKPPGELVYLKEYTAEDNIIDTHIREFITVLNPYDKLESGTQTAGALLSDGSYTDDGRPDKLDLAAEVEGIEEGWRFQVKVYWELDGEQIGEKRTLEASEKTAADTYRIEMEDVPVGKDLKRAQRYDLRAVAEVKGKWETVDTVRNVGFSYWCDTFTYSAQKDEEGNWLAELEGPCAGLMGQVQENYLYGVCVCGQAPLEPQGTITECDFMCYDNIDAPGAEEHSCQPKGPAGIPTNYIKSSNCYDPSWDEAAEEFENSGL